MVKKRLASGEACRKCVQAEDMLKSRGLWERIDEVVWADERNPESPGMVLGRKHDVDLAPFFLVRDGEREAVYTSVLMLVKEQLTATRRMTTVAPATDDDSIAQARAALASSAPAEIMHWGLSRFGRDCAIAFSGAEDVVLIDMAATSGLPYSVFCLDTGRLHPETYEFIDEVRRRYGIEILLTSPDPAELMPLVREKGLFSFHDDGHGECCGIRKVAPLTRALSGFRAWMTGQRRDQSPETRAEVPIIQRDDKLTGVGGSALVKLNPLAGWSSAQVWSYIREHNVPYNRLHERGFVSIGCAPCTRPVLPGQHEREGRWWWELAAAKECGLHSK